MPPAADYAAPPYMLRFRRCRHFSRLICYAEIFAQIRDMHAALRDDI